MKLLITGGAGFIGSEIVRQLAPEHDITVLDSMSEQIHGKNWESSYLYQSIRDRCRFILGSVCDFETVRKALEGQEAVIHLAAETGTGQSMYEINHYNETNIMGTSNLLQAISLMGESSMVRKIILSSSRSVYGEGRYVCPRCGDVYPGSRSREKLMQGDFNLYCPVCGAKVAPAATQEDSRLRPSSLYAFTKQAQESMLQTMCPALGVDLTIFRFQNVYGAGQSLNNPYTGILSIFSSLLLAGKDVNVFEDGLESRDFIHVSDVAKAVIRSLDCEESNGEVINLGSGEDTSVLEVACLLKKIYGSRSEIHVTGDFRIGDIAHNKADIRKARRILDFYPSVGLEEGLTSFCAWVLKQERDLNTYEQSLQEMEDTGMFIRKNGK